MKDVYFLLCTILLWSCNTKDKGIEANLLPGAILISEELSAQLLETTIEAETITDDSILVLPGYLSNDTPEQFIISLPMPGRLNQIIIKHDYPIKKGELLVVYKNPQFLELKRDYLKAKSNFEFQKSRYSRLGELAIEHATSLKKLQEAEWAFSNAEIELKYLESYLKILGIKAQDLNLNNLNEKAYLYSTYSGRIISEKMQLGKYYNTDEEIFTLSGNNNLMVYFESNYSPNLKPGDTILCNLIGENQNLKIAQVQKIAYCAETFVHTIKAIIKDGYDIAGIKNIEANVPVSIKYLKVPFSVVHNRGWVFVQQSKRIITPIKIDIVAQEGSDLLIRFSGTLVGKKIIGSDIEELLDEF